MRILLTAGPTREHLDPVRYLSNASSGRMGYAIAAAARDAGHAVTLVTGPVHLPPPKDITVHAVVSARDMHAVVMRLLPGHDAFIATAAVSDYRPATTAAQKIKKDAAAMTLELERNPDILGEAGDRYEGKKLLIGFALESENGEVNARAKLQGKRLDAVVLNGPAALDADTNEVWVYTRAGAAHHLGPAAKIAIARELIALLPSLRHAYIQPRMNTDPHG